MPEDMKKLEEISLKRQQEIESLLHASSHILKSVELQGVLQAIVEKASELFSADSTSLFLVDKHGEVVLEESKQSKREEKNKSKKTSEDTTRGKVTNLETALNQDAKAFIGVPLKIRENVIGVLRLESSTPRAFTNEEAKLLELFASQAAIAIENARLLEEAGEKAEALQRSLAIEALNSGNDILDKEKPRDSSRNLDFIEFDIDRSTFTNHITPDLLANIIIPYIRAVSQLQQIIDEIKIRESREVYIKSISQNSPVSVSLDGASDAIQIIRDILTPWRRKHMKELASLLEREKLLEIEYKKAEVLERHALAEKSRNEARKIFVEIDKQREEVQRMKLENDKMRIELHREKIKLALDVLNYITPNLSEAEKIAYAVKLLQPLDTLVMNEIAISVDKK